MLVAVAIATATVAVAELSGEREVIFPEITALAAGYLVAPKRSWQVSPARMVGLIGVCSAAGLLISVGMPGPMWGEGCVRVRPVPGGSAAHMHDVCTHDLRCGAAGDAGDHELGVSGIRRRVGDGDR